MGALEQRMGCDGQLRALMQALDSHQDRDDKQQQMSGHQRREYLVHRKPWSLEFADPRTESAFRLAQGRGQIYMDHLMYITMMFWYFILPVLEVGLLQGECVSPLMFARGAAVAVPSLLSIFCEDRYIRWRDPLLAVLAFMPLTHSPAASAPAASLMAHAFSLLRESLGFRMRLGLWAPWRVVAVAGFVLVNYPRLFSTLQWTWSVKVAALLTGTYAIRSVWMAEACERERFARALDLTSAKPMELLLTAR